MEVIRADQEQVGGTIHKPMYERLMLSDFAIADVTGANPNVYYELGIRHALRPRTTVMVFAEGTTLPFDVASQRGTPYRMDESGNLTDVAGDVAPDHRAPARRAMTTPTTTARCSSSSTACRGTRSTTSRPMCSATASPLPQDYKKRLAEARSEGRRCGPRHRRRSRRSPTCAASRPASSST